MEQNNTKTRYVSEDLTNFLFYLDGCQRILSVLINLMYFIVVLKYKKLRNKSYIFLNHFMFANLIYCCIYLLYIKSETPNFSYSKLNHAVCSTASVIWSVCKYLRFYSILLVSIHRLIAVYYINLFRKINKSRFSIIFLIFIVWFISATIAFISKFIFQTTYGPNNCFDGYSKSFNQSLNYYLFTVFFGMALPTLSVILIYVLIYKRLRRMSFNLSSKLDKKNKRIRNIEEITSNNYLPTEILLTKENATNYNRSSSTALNYNIESIKIDPQLTENMNINSSNKSKTYRACRKTQTRFANQFLAINFCLIISFLALSLGSMRNMFLNLNENYYFITQILRIINILAAALIPIFSLFYPRSMFKSILK